MPSNPLTQAEVNEYAISRILTPPGELNPYMPQGYFLATPPVGDGPALWRLFDPEYIQGIIPADKLGTGSLGLGSLYLADDGTWKGIGGSLPPGGTAGQLLAKINDTDYNVEWIDNYALWTSQVKHEVKAGEVLLKGQAVYVSSADGTNMIVSKASNAAEVTSSKTMGLIAQNLALNGKGFVITEGLLSGLNTSAATVGDPVWLGTNGNLLYGIANKPVAPAHMVFLGIVTRVQSSNGEIFVKVQNGFELDELHDVLITSKTDKDILAYEASSGLWKNKSFLALFGGTPLVSIPTLAQVTTAGNTTTNSITVGGLTVATNLIYTDTVHGRVGIGTASPAYKLDVVGDINASGNIISQTNLQSMYQAGDEGGEITLNKPVTGTTIDTSLTIDIYQDKLRIFETGGLNRGGYFDISTLANGVGTNLAPTGWTGIITTMLNPPGQQNIQVSNGIITNVF